jgi:rare lipoprotein A
MNRTQFPLTSRPLYWLTLLCSVQLAGCALHRNSTDSAPAQQINLATIPDAVPQHEPRSERGNPAFYQVNGHTYHLLANANNYAERGVASWYGTKFHGRATSSGETYDMYKMTAAHRTLPIPCYLQVTNLQNGQQVVVRVNDRGPFHANRIIDLSYAAAKKLGITGNGTGLVAIRSITPAAGRQRNAKPVTIAATATRDEKKENVQIFVQAGAFSSRENAEQLQQQLTALVEPQHITAKFDQGDKLYRVRIGPLATVEEADRLTQLITTKGFTAPHLVVD